MTQKFISRYCQLLSVIMVVCLAVRVVLRYGFNSGIFVSEELSRWLFLWLVFMGSTIAIHEQGHIVAMVEPGNLARSATEVVDAAGSKILGVAKRMVSAVRRISVPAKLSVALAANESLLAAN